MSLVGPRPEVPRYVEAFSKEYAKILQVRPGITDYAAIEYRDENTLLDGADDPEKMYLEIVLPEKIKYYCRYLENMGLKTDLSLILKTILGIK